ncbi:hypothetical protein [Psychrobacter sp. I-STPA6b]|uniref:hypothetical protein n=1 Tax=Psychrobacter sp. I-STPA6b TaxID=2585718 RepID=UPI001D0CD400|nr:hypothetical protein [Psychrobacter sp. I-STPA6b]
MLLIRLTTPTEQACYEGCALALTLATFGHEVQLYLDSAVFGVLLQPSSRLHGMIKSLELYDLPPAWLPQENSSGWLIGMLPAGVASQVCLVPTDAPIKNATQVLSF